MVSQKEEKVIRDWVDQHPYDGLTDETRIQLIVKWIASLRSGEYTQGSGALKRPYNGTFKHCCLGVLCELSIQELGIGEWAERQTFNFGNPYTYWFIWNRTANDVKESDQSMSNLPIDMRRVVGFKEWHLSQLIRANDDPDSTFDDIALDILTTMQ